MSKTLELAKQLIRFPSITPHDKDCQNVLKKRLSKLGFTITDIPCQKASNFWATLGQNGPSVVFAGHTDVVETGPLEHWDTDPFEPIVKNGMLYGRGAADMKSSLASMVIACEQFCQRFPDFKGTIGFLITSAEEGPSELGTPVVLDYLKRQDHTIDYCIVGEPTASEFVGDTVKNGRRGSLTGHLTIKGKQGHIAYPHLAKNPIHIALAALDEFIQIKWDEGNNYFPATSLQISNIKGGTGAGNVIPGHLDVHFNFRYCTEVTSKLLQARSKSLFDKYPFTYQIKWTHYGKPFLTGEGILLDAARIAIEQACEIQPQLSTTGGTSDGRYIADHCSEVIELGPCNKTIHQVNEHVSVTDIDTLTNIYENLLIQLLVES